MVAAKRKKSLSNNWELICWLKLAAAAAATALAFSGFPKFDGVEEVDDAAPAADKLAAKSATSLACDDDDGEDNDGELFKNAFDCCIVLKLFA